MGENNTILVVGGAGHVGSHTTIALNDASFETVVYDNFSTGHRIACFGTHLDEGDLADRAKLEETMKQFHVTGDVHFAALIEAGQSVATSLPYFQNNVAGSSINKIVRDAWAYAIRNH